MPKRRYRHTWDQIASLDSDFMNGWGAFEPDRRETVDFDDTALPEVAFAMQADGRGFEATYQFSSTGQARGAGYTHARVAIERRPCQFGGSRVYFICPTCQKTTRRLAVLPVGLQCGTCGLVTWETRRRRPAERLMLKAGKIAQQLGGDDWRSLPAKRPLYMRTVRFEVLRQEYAATQDALNAHLRHTLVRKGLIAGRRVAN